MIWPLGLVRQLASGLSPEGPLHICQRCGAPLNGEAAWVNDEVWCHPCADEEDPYRYFDGAKFKEDNP